VEIGDNMFYSLFVYGTLLPGERNHHILEEIDAKYVGKHYIYGQLYTFNNNYPCAILNYKGKIKGSIYIISSFKQLDSLEGYSKGNEEHNLFNRIDLSSQCCSGLIIYIAGNKLQELINKPISNYKPILIPNGDWVTYRKGL
jgi:gamma-glutamylcyclotransferase (GGCT)/AIG2-like uncharacterized protein YtfP